jgi:hypothetical protein
MSAANTSSPISMLNKSSSVSSISLLFLCRLLLGKCRCPGIVLFCSGVFKFCYKISVGRAQHALNLFLSYNSACLRIWFSGLSYYSGTNLCTRFIEDKYITNVPFCPLYRTGGGVNAKRSYCAYKLHYVNWPMCHEHYCSPTLFVIRQLRLIWYNI